MKKQFSMLATAAACLFAMSSCSQDEVVYNNQTAGNDEIVFTAGVDKATRHTGDVTTANLDKFYVTAFLRDPEFDPKNPSVSPDAKAITYGSQTPMTSI